MMQTSLGKFLNSSGLLRFAESVLYGPICPYVTSVSIQGAQHTLGNAVPRTLAEYNHLRSLKPIQPDNPKLLRVAIVGLPNVGKSTLINQLMQWQICSVSKKVHTTRQNARAVLVKGDTQIVFLDTPGVVDLDHGKKHHLEATMVVGAEHSLTNGDAVGVMVDASDHWRRDKIDSNILRLLSYHRDTDAFLILNKVDVLNSKRKLLETIHSLTQGIVDGNPTFRWKRSKKKHLNPEELFRKAESALNSDTNVDTVPEANEGGWPHFKKVFMISALNDDGVEDIRNYLLTSAKSQQWLFPRHFVTDQNPHEIAVTTVKSKILDNLDKEVPYNLEVDISTWDVDTAGVLHIAISIKGNNARHVKHVIGGEGKIIKKIAAESRQELANTFRCEVSLKLIVNKVE